MKNALLLTENQTHFLQENRQDPITGDDFSLGDEIVFCAECKSAFLKESWEYMDGKHCNQNNTLVTFPTLEKLLLEKPVNKFPRNFISKKTESRLSAFYIDFTIIFFVLIIVVAFVLLLDINRNYLFYIGSVLFVFRDTFFINQSIGKRINKIYFVDSKTKEDAIWYKVFVRNLIWWALNGLIVTQFSMFLVPILLVTNLIHILYIARNNQSFLDKLLNIELVNEKEMRGILGSAIL